MSRAAAETAVSEPGSFIRIEDIAKSFSGVPAVAGVSLEIRRGELFCLLGASGSGKTTLLRMLAGFERPDRGAISIDGADVTAMPPYLRPVNLMFQSYALFPHMSVEGNIAFGLRQENLSRSEIARRVDEMLALVQMTAFARRRPHELSGGQRQRTALARALAKLPKVLLLDEPLAALDRKLREETRQELVAIQARLGITFIVVTHDAEEAMGMASRIAILKGGKLAQIGSPSALYDRPRSRYVADFLGPVNLFECEILGHEPGSVVLRLADLDTELRVPDELGTARTGRAWLAIRPERMTQSIGVAPVNRMRGVLRAAVFRGESHSCRIELPNGKSVLFTAPTVVPIPRQGESVELSWPPSAGVVLFE